jgi:hypothetical protein
MPASAIVPSGTVDPPESVLACVLVDDDAETRDLSGMRSP